MILEFQRSALAELHKLADVSRHSILIVGSAGIGKTYLAQQFARIQNISDIQVISPKVDAIRRCIRQCYSLDSDIVIVIENLDLGVAAASNALLKFLEEPLPHVYIVVTARNITNVVDTIKSRSAIVTIQNPATSDITAYASSLEGFHPPVSTSTIWKTARSLSDCEDIVALSPKQLDEITSAIPNTLNTLTSTSIQSAVWTFSHYSDNTNLPTPLVIKYILVNTINSTVRSAAMSYMRDYEDGRIAKHAILAKFLMECKYC